VKRETGGPRGPQLRASHGFGADLDGETFVGGVSRDLRRDRAYRQETTSPLVVHACVTACLAYVSRFCYYCASLSRPVHGSICISPPTVPSFSTLAFASPNRESKKEKKIARLDANSLRKPVKHLRNTLTGIMYFNFVIYTYIVCTSARIFRPSGLPLPPYKCLIKIFILFDSNPARKKLQIFIFF
jgi:hypothetical protein